MKFRLSVVLVAAVAAACAQRGEPAPVTGWQDSAAMGRTIRVERGDTLFGIAHRYDQPVRLLIAANHLVPPYRLEVGQTLVLPGPETPLPDRDAYAAAAPPIAKSWQRPSDAPAKPAETRRAAEAPRIASLEVPPPEHRETRLAGAHSDQPPPDVRPAAAVVPPREAVAPSDIGAHGFIWPVRGRIVESYGAGRNGTQNDGINIAARPGSPVYAAAAGEVVYVGNELRGYGNLVLIKHDGGFLTAYAHNAALLVHKGEHVARGQAIARVGSTGQVSEPQLHFEIRRGRNPVDPMQYLPPEQQASIGE